MTSAATGPINLLLDAETNGFTYVWQSLDEVVYEASSTFGFTRYIKNLNIRVPTKLRIQRWGDSETYGGVSYPDPDNPNLDIAFTVIDNIRVSPPPAAVVVSKGDCVFHPGHPYIGTNLTIRCYVDNVDMHVPTNHTARTVTVRYRWRYLDQSIGVWKTNVMDYVGAPPAPGDDGLGNGERYKKELPAQAQVGDLEYYFVCDSDGYRYQSPDYTGLGYPYPAESDPSWPNQLRGGASEPDGREFYVRLRPYRSPYGAVYVVTDDPAVPPVEMALVGDNQWQGMVPRTDVADTNLSFYFKAVREYVRDEDTFSTNTVCWSEGAQTGAGRVPFGGVCVETNDAGRIRVKADSGGYVMVTFNTDTKEYMTRRAEYQNFNAWPAPPEKFSESSGQSAKQSFANSFETWPVNTETRYSEFLDLISSIPTTNVYSREPFPTPREWMAGSAAFVVERVDADIYNKPGSWTGITVQNHALRLKGGDSALGLGYVHNTRASRTDGIKALSFKYRLGQPASNFDVTYDRTGFTKTNYMIKVTARVYGTMSPERPFMSVIGYYRDPGNFYEYRVSQIRVGTDESRLEHQLYKWENGSPKPLNTSVTKDDADLISGNRTLEMRFFNQTDGTRIYCLYNDSSRINIVELNANSPHIYGTYGFLSADCEAGFSNAQTQPTTTGAALVAGSTPVTVLYGDNNIGGQIENWYTPAGRYAFNTEQNPKRIQAVIPDQRLGVYLQTAEPGSDAEPSAPGTTGWKKFQELTVTGFGYSTNAVTVKDWKTQYVMLQVSGMTNTLSVTDVAVDELAVTSWRGQQSGSGAADAWLATEAWVASNNVSEGHVVQLDHSRADPDEDQAIRSLLLETGMGMMEFDYRVVRGPAQLTVQYAPKNDSEAWEPVQSYVVTNSSWTHIYAYLGTNAPGYLRVLNDRSGAYSNAWVEINNAMVWDEPVVEETAWRAYNVKITDTDLQRVLLDETKACFLNNSPTLDADPIQNQNVPFLQSPVLPNGLGELTFLARAYSNNQASAVYVYASTNGWSAPTNLWFKITEFTNITNMFYQAYTFKPADGRAYDSVKLLTTTTPGSRRACVEEVVMSEPVFPGFDIVNVQVVCKEINDFDLGKHQPVDTDEVGIQAEIANKQLSPSNILMYVDYYIGTNVWGVDNWPSNAVVTLPMEQTAPGSAIYRTSPTNTIPPQDSDQVVQYRVRAEYMGGVPLVKTQEVFENPAWYYPVDLNAKYASQGWSPYYIVYGVPKGSIWINEVNATEYVVSNGVPQSGFWDNPYIEIAVPAGVDLAGWKLELVSVLGTETITFPQGSVLNNAVTNGYAFFVVGEKYPDAGMVPLPRVDFAYGGFSAFIPAVYAGGLRLRRPMGMYEQAMAYDWDPAQGGEDFDGELWAAAHSEGGYVYVGKEHYNGSLSVTNRKGEARADWTFPLYWTPGMPNVGQMVPPAELGASNVWIVSTMSSLNGVQNGQRKLYDSFKLRVGTDTNILYEADDWYRISSVTVNAIEQLPPGTQERSVPVAITDVKSNVTVSVQFSLRQDIANLGLGTDMLNWLLGFSDGTLVPSYYNNGRELSLTELYWLDADPTRTNRLDGGIANFVRDDATTNFYVTVSLALNGTNCTYLQSEAVMKLEMAQSLMNPEWWIVGQYVLMPDSFDTNHLCRILLPNPYLNQVPYWDPKQAFFHWVIEEWDPRISPQPLVNTAD